MAATESHRHRRRHPRPALFWADPSPRPWLKANAPFFTRANSGLRLGFFFVAKIKASRFHQLLIRLI
jgi:hypothetical protein